MENETSRFDDVHPSDHPSASSTGTKLTPTPPTVPALEAREHRASCHNTGTGTVIETEVTKSAYVTENERANANRDLRLLFLPLPHRHVHSGCGEEVDKIHAEGRIGGFKVRLWMVRRPVDFCSRGRTLFWPRRRRRILV